MLFRRLSTLVLLLGTLSAPLAAHADADGWITLGLGAGLSVGSGPGTEEAATTHFNLGARLKMLKFLGVDLSFAPGAEEYAAGIEAPTLRFTALLYFLNFPHFSMFGAAGMTGRSFSDVVDPQGEGTRYRAGGGIELTYSEHYSLGLEGYWLVPGVGMVEQRMKSSLQETGEVLTVDEAFPTDGFELVFGVRYFF